MHHKSPHAWGTVDTQLWGRGHQLTNCFRKQHFQWVHTVLRCSSRSTLPTSIPFTFYPFQKEDAKHLLQAYPFLLCSAYSHIPMHASPTVALVAPAGLPRSILALRICH